MTAIGRTGAIRRAKNLGLAVALLVVCFHCGPPPPSPSPRGDAGNPTAIVLKDDSPSNRIGARTLVELDRAPSPISSSAIPQGPFEAGRDQMNFGFTDARIWLVFKVRNAGSRNDWMLTLDFPLIDQLHLFAAPAKQTTEAATAPPANTRTEAKTSGLELIQRSGNFVPFGERPHPSRRFLLDMQLEPGAERHYFLAVDSTDTVQLNPEIVHAEEFLRRERLDRLLVGAYFGLLAAMLLYNGFLFAVLRDPSYFWYLLFLISSGLFIASQLGVAYEYLWPDYPWWSMRFNPVGNGIMIAIILTFLRRVLDPGSYAPRGELVLRFGIGLGLVQAFVSLFVPFTVAALGAVTVSSYATVAGFGVLYRAVQHGVPGARAIGLAWILYILGGVVYLLKTIGLFPNTTLTAWSLPLGSALEMVVISIALGSRFSKLRQEREEAQLRLQFIEQELQIGRKLQESLLPASVPELPQLQCVTHYAPYIAVGGDFYDFAESAAPAGLGVLIADAAGHGVGSALMASMVKMAFTDQRSIGHRPAQLIAAINRAIHGQSDQSIVSAAYVFFDFQRRRISYVNGGHPAMVYCPAGGEPREIEHRGPLLGWRPDFEYHTHEFDVRPGDRLILYTDGITEAQNLEGELFGEERLLSVARDCQGRPGEELRLQLLDASRMWTLETGVTDDLALIIIDLL